MPTESIIYSLITLNIRTNEKKKYVLTGSIFRERIDQYVHSALKDGGVGFYPGLLLTLLFGRLWIPFDYLG